jgi:nucleotide-binding universal stress UspA family protein
MNILLAIDDSPHSAAALEGVLARPWPDGSCFKVVSVVEPFHPEYAGWHTSYVPLALEAQKELLDSTKHMVSQAAAELQDRFGKEAVSLEVLEGYIKDKILEIAREWPADLIVMGSHGHRGFTRFLLGSVSEAVVSHAPCSVEIVKLAHPEVSGGQPAVKKAS